ncbi:MAG TPA: hypothetical protein VFQ44_28635 [Streptosporangiaceae bacterium]|nr:hypothetical protein [Streptosporangiaceae bacterium]
MRRLQADQEYSLSEAARLIEPSVKAVHTEASRLVACGFITDSRRGNVRLLRAASGTPLRAFD